MSAVQGTQGLHKHLLQFHQTLRAPRKMNIENVKTMLYLGFNHLLSTALATKNEPEASEVLHLPHKIIIVSQIKNDDSFTKRDFGPFQSVGQILRLPRKNLQNHISFWPTPADVLATCKQ